MAETQVGQEIASQIHEISWDLTDLDVNQKLILAQQILDSISVELRKIPFLHSKEEGKTKQELLVLRAWLQEKQKTLKRERDEGISRTDTVGQNNWDAMYDPDGRRTIKKQRRY